MTRVHRSGAFSAVASQRTSGLTVDEGLGTHTEGLRYRDGLEAFISDSIPATLLKIKGRRWVCELTLVDPNMCDDAEGIFCAGPAACIPNSVFTQLSKPLRIIVQISFLLLEQYLFISYFYLDWSSLPLYYTKIVTTCKY
jgi:hypothetical protein